MERLGSIAGAAIQNTAVGQTPGTAAHAAVTGIAGLDVAAETKARVVAGVSEAEAALSVLNDIKRELSTIDVGQEINRAATALGQTAADRVNTALKDIAQKFDGFGKDAATYFEGRARFMSVMVAIVLAFAVHVDAIDLFKTYLRDPNARAKVIEQSQAITAQYKASEQAIASLKTLAPTETKTVAQPNTPPGAPKTDQEKADQEKAEQEKAEKEKAEKEKAKAKTDDIKKQVDDLENDTRAAIASASATVKQFADIGVPLGWNDDRRKAAHMKLLVWSCKEYADEKKKSFLTTEEECKADEKTYKGLENRQYKNVYLQVPLDLGIWFYLLLGGLLIGLGSPFWFDAVTSLTNLRSAAGGASGSGAQAAPAAPPVAGADKAQPVTPVGAFHVSNEARKP
jgi:hypothetical protein